MVALLPVALADLLEVATYVYCADQAFSRGGKRIVDYGQGWRRRFRFRIAVRLPELWSGPEVIEALVDGLSFMSDDTLEFEFSKLENPPDVSDYLNFNESTPNVAGIEEVCLFSGGLDSLAGAVKEILGDRRKVALVSHRSNPKVSKRQHTLVDMIDERCPHAKRPLHIPIWIHKQGAPTRDYMQRTRSFLYASLAAVVAGMFDLNRIRFHENGTVSFNLPICAQVIGARATRTTHPRTLDAFAKLFSLLLGADFRIDNPFLLKTRAEVAGSVRDAGQGDLIGHTVSCPHTHAMTTPQPHCGVCSQCIDRRFATLAAGCTDEDPGSGYRVDLFTGERKKTEDQTMIERYVGTANKIEAMSDAEQFCTEFPEVCDALRYVEGSADDAAGRIFDLYRRHAQEVRSVLKQEVVRHADDLINGSLPKTCFLRIALGADEGARRELRDAQKRGSERPSRAEGKEVPWNPDDEDYVPAKDAVAYVKEINQDFDYGDLNKVLTRDGPMQHMRNPDKEEKGPGSVRCKVHKGDLETWCDGLRRAPTAKARPGGGKPAKPTHSGDGLYEKGFAEGHQEGYRQGYTEVKERKRYSCEPSFQDAPDDSYVHGQYEGWKAGYKEGRRDSENGEPQKHGARE
jgi:hypothetical protein